MFRLDEPAAEAPPAPGYAGAPAPSQDPVEAAVLGAYLVLEESMRKGQEAARRYPHVFTGVSSMYDPYYRSRHHQPQSPVTFFWNQMANMWMGMVGAMMQPFMGGACPPPPSAEGWQDEENLKDLYPPAPEQSTRFSTETREPERPPTSLPQWPWFQLIVLQPQTRKPAKVSVDISPESDLGNLKLLPMHDLNHPDRFIHGELERTDDRALMLRLNLKEGESGTFYGSIFDLSRKQPCGYVRVILEG